ncbi:MAG: deaminase [Nitrospirae bacterium]|nr:deaminase [Nitrospirota bacterium]
MADKKIFFTDKAPMPKGPYSQAVIHNGLLYLSGQIPVDPVTAQLVRGTIEEETERVIHNMKIIIEEAGAKLEDILKVTCYLADMEDLGRFNDVYKNYFSENPPVRTTVQAAGLPLDVQVEIDAIVALPYPKSLTPAFEL